MIGYDETGEKIEILDWPCTTRPTWEHDLLLLNKMRELSSGNQILQWHFGAEIDFQIHDTEAFDKDQDWMDRKRQKAIEVISSKSKYLSEEEIKGQISEVASFNAKDLLLFEIHEKLRDIIEYRFGPHEHQIGWYDSPGCPEIRTKVYEAEDFVTSYYAIINEIKALEKKYRLRVEILGSHINFSPWQYLGEQLINLAEMQDEESRLKMAILMTGVLDAVSKNAFFLFDHAGRITDSADSYDSIGLSRSHLFRACLGRVEFRKGLGDKIHLPALMCTLMQGALHALEPEPLSQDLQSVTLVDAVKYKIPVSDKRNPWDDLFNIRRILQASVLDSVLDYDGKHLILPLEYVTEVCMKAIKELFGSEVFSDLKSYDEKFELAENDIRLIFSKLMICYEDNLPRLDLSELKIWWEEKAASELKCYSKLTDKSFENIERKFQQIKTTGSFTTMFSKHKIQISPLFDPRNFAAVKEDPVLISIYGEEVLADMPYISNDPESIREFLKNQYLVLIKDKSASGSDCSAEEMCKELRESLKTALPKIKTDELDDALITQLLEIFNDRNFKSTRYGDFDEAADVLKEKIDNDMKIYLKDVYNILRFKKALEWYKRYRSNNKHEYYFWFKRFKSGYSRGQKIDAVDRILEDIRDNNRITINLPPAAKQGLLGDICSKYCPASAVFRCNMVMW